MLGDFAGNSQYPGNSIAVGVIGATIGGGGVVYDASSTPKHPSRMKLASPAGRVGKDSLRNPLFKRSPLQSDGGEGSAWGY